MRLKQPYFTSALLISLTVSLCYAEPISEADLHSAVPIDTQIEFIADGDNPFPILIQEAVRADALGSLVILTDTQSQQRWLEQSNPLRLYLAQHGWQTLSLPLPDKPIKTDRVSEEDFTEQLTDYENQVMVRIESGLDLVSEERIVLLAMGRSAEWAIRVIQNQPDMHLFMLNPRPIDDNEPRALLEGMTAVESRIIDLFQEPYPSDQKAIPDALTRKNAMIRSNHPHYHQQAIKEALWSSQPDWLNRQIRGLLNTYIVKAEEHNQAPGQDALAVDELPPGVRQ